MTADPRSGFRRLCSAVASGKLAALCRRHGVRLLVVFGSVARGAAEPHDLDVAVAFEPHTKIDFLGLLEDLVQLSGIESIDLMDLSRANPVVRERALVGAVPLFEGERSAFANAQMAAMLERMETEPLRRLDLELMAR